MKVYKRDSLIHKNFLTMISKSLLYCCKKVFGLSMWIYGWLNNSVKHHYQRKKDHLNMVDVTDADYVHAERACKDFF